MRRIATISMMMMMVIGLVFGKDNEQHWMYCVEHELDQGLFCGSYIEHVTLWVSIPLFCPPQKFNFLLHNPQYTHTDPSKHDIQRWLRTDGHVRRFRSYEERDMCQRSESRQRFHQSHLLHSWFRGNRDTDTGRCDLARTILDFGTYPSRSGKR